MRFIEAIACELLHQIKNSHRQIGIDAFIFRTTLNTDRCLAISSGFSYPWRGVRDRPTRCVTGQFLGDLNPLLVKNDAVSLPKNRF